MKEVDKCCCCISIKTGVYIIGAWHILILLGGLFEAQYLRVTIELFTALSFMVMIFRDSIMTRMYFFATYCIFCVIWNIIMIGGSYNVLRKKTLMVEKCKEEGIMKALQTSSMDECVMRLTRSMEGEMIVFLVLHGLMQVHFCFVLYTHWQNGVKDWSLPSTGAETGTISDTQMQHIQN